MLFWAVVSDSTDEAVELFTTREEAETIVQRRLSRRGLERAHQTLVARATEG
jgi:hypothetical protein